MRAILIVTGIALAAQTPSAVGQGTFQNLAFESANVVLLSGYPTGGTIAASNALPGWTAFAGTNQLSTIPYNNTISRAPVELWGSNGVVIHGSFSVSLLGIASIEQSGLIPGDVGSLLFTSGSSSLIVALDGQSLPFTFVSSASYYSTYAANISAFAGRSATLTFSVPMGSGTILDDIRFSSESVPEPGAGAMMGIGGLLLARLRRRPPQ